MPGAVLHVTIFPHGTWSPSTLLCELIFCITDVYNALLCVAKIYKAKQLSESLTGVCLISKYCNEALIESCSYFK